MKAPRLAIDIGSTIVKIAAIGDDDAIVEQHHFARDYDVGIPAQVAAILVDSGMYNAGDEVLICSSANGGLRAGVLCLSEQYSGATLRDQVLLAGANPIFVHELDKQPQWAPAVDVLIIGGGINDADCRPMRERIEALELARYRFSALIYAGSDALADLMLAANASVVQVANPLATGLHSGCNSVFEAMRDAYLSDLVHKEGISELPATLAKNIHPTPEVVNRGFQRMISDRSTMSVSGATVIIDIGGATTDLHYTVEIVRDDSPDKPAAGSSVARYVFTDLGVFASRDSTSMQMRTHPRIYEFLTVALGADVRETYQQMREGEYDPAAEMLAYGCLFIALERFASGRGPGLPTVNLSKISNIVLTGGAAQLLDVVKVQALIALFNGEQAVIPQIIVDRRYQLWVDGITWQHV